MLLLGRNAGGRGDSTGRPPHVTRSCRGHRVRRPRSRNRPHVRSNRDGQVWCWGASAHGALGDGGGAASRPYPRAVNSPAIRFKSVVAGGDHTCALAEDGRAWCWGQNLAGQLGDSSFANERLTPVRVAQGAVTFTSIAVDGSVSCALASTGEVFCWGSNFSGQLGDSTTGYRRFPKPVPGVESDFTSLAVGATHVCGLTPDGRAGCWGKSANLYTPFPSASLAPGQQFVSLASPAGGGFQCGVASGGQAACWGVNSSGQLVLV
jgi:alpha-tubulin suppressor-like RCC1 family protein